MVAVGVVVVSFIVPVAIDKAVDDSDDVSNFDNLSGVGDGEANNGVVKQPEPDSLGNVNITKSNRRCTRNSVLCALAQKIDTMVFFHLAFHFIFLLTFL